MKKIHWGSIVGELVGLVIAWWIIVSVPGWNLPMVINEKWISYVNIGLAVAVADFGLSTLAILFGGGVVSCLLLIVKDGVSLWGTWNFLKIYPLKVGSWLSLNMDIDAGIRVAMLVSMAILVGVMVVKLVRLIGQACR